MGDRGYGSVLALALLFGGILLVGLAVDVARLVSAWQEASHVAHSAAEVGAGWVDPDGLYAGLLELDRPSAREAAERFIEATDLDGSVRIRDGRVCVSVSTRVRPGITRLVGAGAQRVEVTACAEPRQG